MPRTELNQACSAPNHIQCIAITIESFFSCANIIKARSPACCLLLNDKYLLLLLATWQYVALVKLPNVFTPFFDATKMAVVGSCWFLLLKWIILILTTASMLMTSHPCSPPLIHLTQIVHTSGFTDNEVNLVGNRHFLIILISTVQFCFNSSPHTDRIRVPLLKSFASSGISREICRRNSSGARNCHDPGRSSW